MIYVAIGFAMLAAVTLARRFVVTWRRESARIDCLLDEFNAEIDARTPAAQTSGVSRDS